MIKSKIITVLLISLVPGALLKAQSDVSIGPYYKLNLQRQTDNADAYIFHNAKVDVASSEIFRWETSHSTFGSRGISFKYYAGMLFFADGVPTTAGTAFTPTPRFIIGNDGRIGVGTLSPRGKFDVDGLGDIYLSDDPEGSSGQSLFIPGHIYISPYNGSNIAYLQARRFSNSGTTSLRLRTYNAGALTEAMHIEGNGYVGIGTISPSQKLEVNGNTIQNAENAAFGIDARPDARLGFIKKFGAWPVIASDNATPIVFSQTNQVGIHTNISGATVTERMRIEVNGNVGIGTTNPDEKLTVNGTIHSKEVKVDMSVPGPDYVFEKDYNLLSLIELETYINQNKHLPEVPSAKDMEKEGLNLKEMNLILLKKVEELTLHLIEQQKQIDQLKKLK
jgi:hypothetical protein